jgi:hypothetical protein
VDTRRGMPAVRLVARPLALFLGVCASSATGAAGLAWMYLPYEQLERFSPQERFLAWEGVVWLLALGLGLLGISCVLQVVGYRVQDGFAELARHLTAPESDSPLVVVSAVLPWGMITCGLFLVLIAVMARSLVGP